jgi:hypothetical protein
VLHAPSPVVFPPTAVPALGVFVLLQIVFNNLLWVLFSLVIACKHSFVTDSIVQVEVHIST